MARDNATTGTTRRTHADWIGTDAYDRSGEKIGEITQVYLDNETRRPEWLAIKTGWFGTNVSFAPIVGTSEHQDGVRIDADKDTVKNAPNISDDGELSADEERRLYEHYHIDPIGGRDAYVAKQRTKKGYDTGRRFDRDFDVDEAALTRREEELQVGTHREETGKVRLRKYVTTEQETITVPVEKEHVVVERENASGSATRGTGEIGDETVEMTLHEDRVDTDKRVVDKETVRATKKTDRETEKVQADLRKEHVDVDGDVDRRS
jgi:uncharacterized protein (TIGR02271 family)